MIIKLQISISYSSMSHPSCKLREAMGGRRQVNMPGYSKRPAKPLADTRDILHGYFPTILLGYPDVFINLFTGMPRSRCGWANSHGGTSPVCSAGNHKPGPGQSTTISRCSVSLLLLGVTFTSDFFTSTGENSTNTPQPWRPEALISTPQP